MIAGFVADDGQCFETVLKFDEVIYDEESLSNEERFEVLQQKELISELLDGGTQLVEYLKNKEEKKMSKDISTRQDQNCILVKERVEECIHHVYQTIGEIGDGDRLMLCSDQHNRGIPEEISTGTSESHVFETSYWCMTAVIEEHLDDVLCVMIRK